MKDELILNDELVLNDERVSEVTGLQRGGQPGGNGSEPVVVQPQVDQLPQGSEGQRGHIPIVEVIVLQLQSE